MFLPYFGQDLDSKKEDGWDIGTCLPRSALFVVQMALANAGRRCRVIYRLRRTFCLEGA